MSLPSLLETQLRQARGFIDSIGYVPIWQRQAIYLALGKPHPLVPLDLSVMTNEERLATTAQRMPGRAGIPLFQFRNSYGADRTPGHVRRTLLAIRTIEYPFAFWENPAWYNAQTKEKIEHLMTIVRRVADGHVPDFREVSPLLLSLFDAYGDDDIVRAAAGQTYGVACADVDLQVDPLPPFRDDKSLAAFRHDVAGMAAIAAEPHAVDFWRWWIATAVPEAWRSHPGEGDTDAL